MTDRLDPGSDLARIGTISSPDGRSMLIMQADGNLVLYRSNGKARWATGTNGRTVSMAIMQTDGNFVLYGSHGVVVFATGTSGHRGAILVVQDDGNVVIYANDGQPLWATGTNVVEVDVPRFLPSTSGFHFSNSGFKEGAPDLTIDILGNRIPIGDASNGLCGGMVFAVRDYFEARTAIPPDAANPNDGPLFDFIVRRLIDSFDLLLPPAPPPAPLISFPIPTPPFGPGPVTYMWLMDPALPDHETIASSVNLAPHGRGWIMVNDQWPLIKRDIDAGRLSPMGLVHLKSLDLTQMGKNHQVLAYGYRLDGTAVSIRIYDPNRPDDDDIIIGFNVGDSHSTVAVTPLGADPVWCFFRPAYIPVAPDPAAVQ